VDISSAAHAATNLRGIGLGHNFDFSFMVGSCSFQTSLGA
jgi:hypothetical protein